MKKAVKTLTLLTMLVCVCECSFAQIKLPVINKSGIAGDVKKVIEDFPNRFINLMGEVMAVNEQSTDYYCNFKVNSAEECFITRYPAKKEICSWEALLLTTDNFEKAKQKFKTLYTQLNNLSVTMSNGTSYRLKGTYEAPVEEMKFTTVLFSLIPNDVTFEKLRIEVSIQFFIPMEWKVKVQVYDKEREDDERGVIKD